MIFVDALDECEEQSVRDMVYYFQSVTDSAHAAGATLDICFSSRHYPTITLPRCPGLSVEDGNRADIARYVRVKLHVASLLDETICSLETQIVRKASGIFLWVALTVEMLIRMVDDGKVAQNLEDALKHVPDVLEELFSNLFNTLKRDERTKAIRLIQWVLFAARPLSPAELSLAITFSSDHPYESVPHWQASGEYVRSPEQMLRFIRSYSRGLVEVKYNVVQLIHESVREFFLSGNGFAILDDSLITDGIGQSHSLISKACLNIVATKDYLSGWPTDWWRLSSYAKEYLFHHGQEAEKNSVKPLCLVDLLTRNEMFLWKRWKSFSPFIDRIYSEEDVTLLYVLCAENPPPARGSYWSKPPILTRQAHLHVMPSSRPRGGSGIPER
ncbi:hypothetical protein EPUS_06238 [Endocarpon pusillum Z07020]|uniref:NACHT domain-containing protein n=1 Tax=Endocarpon pusillum (strain Z07020 / HMAS-L-300199) TaxID=1263415 RepID=U1HIS0_ENDPU|nr:uncharacterized protein EPUS_06238 [Endocarpon pusillum Z07020]ERF68794.1 hypothetical protein EPUS_06238 [Endocarpon pusillum Z07020]